jgi:hypothetical protein
MAEIQSGVEEQIITLNKSIDNYNLLRLRLDPAQIIEQIRLFLNAEIETITQNEKGEIERKVIPIGIPKANEKGRASILNWVQISVNPQVVQGNFKSKDGFSEMYDRYIEEYQKDLGDMIYINLYEYDIDENEAQNIIDAIMKLIIPFMTRLIDDRERQSYGDTFKEVINNSPQQNKGLAGWFKS